MSLEQKIEALTTAVEALTAKMSGASASAAAAAESKAAESKAGKTKPPADAYTPKHTKDEMTAVLNEVKEKFGTPVAKSIVTDIGKAGKMAEITDPKLIDACYEAAKAKMEAGEEM